MPGRRPRPGIFLFGEVVVPRRRLFCGIIGALLAAAAAPAGGKLEVSTAVDGSGRIAATIPHDPEDPGGLLYVLARNARSEAGARHSSRNAR